MPVYVYRNLSTGETFEVEQRITEPALTEHPESGDPVKRLIQPVGIAFKGSGFYVTDSRNTSAGKGSKSKGDGAGADAASSSGGDAKSEATTASKADSTPGAKSEGQASPAAGKDGGSKAK